MKTFLFDVTFQSIETPRMTDTQTEYDKLSVHVCFPQSAEVRLPTYVCFVPWRLSSEKDPGTNIISQTKNPVISKMVFESQHNILRNKSRLGLVTHLGQPRPVYKSNIERYFLESWEKWPNDTEGQCQ